MSLDVTFSTVLLELPKDHKSLFDANAIVRYLASLSYPIDSNGIEASLIEWEENFLQENISENTLAAADSIIGKAEFRVGQINAAQIILFGSLYSKSKDITEQHAALKTWFNSFIEIPQVLNGIENAATYTTPAVPTGGRQSKTKNKAKSAAPKSEPIAIQNSGERRLRSGCEMTVIFEREILPKDGERNILITSALPYVNNVPHLGNIIGSVLSADVFARYNKARNRNTLFICGTDEYGTATETKALDEGVTPQQLCDKFHSIHAEVYKWFEIGFDKFGRTTTPKQTEIAQDIFMKLYDNGFLSEKSTTQLYDETHHKFLADRYVEGICPLCGYVDARGDQCDGCSQLLNPLDLKEPRSKLGGKVVSRESNHIFLCLDKLQQQTEEWVEQSSLKGKWSPNGIHITKNWFKKGLMERGITRDLEWGTPIPLKSMEGKVLYVWFDATIGYISITANYTNHWKSWWQNPSQVELYQFMGKDNVPFHTVIFPASLLGTKQNWTMLHHINTTEYLQYEGGKFSKSRNVGVFGNNAQDTGVPASVWRYYLLSNRPETSDTQFVWSDFISKNNAELLANLGNFVNRVIKFVNAKYGGVVPEFSLEKDVGVVNQAGFISDVNGYLSQYIDALEAAKERAGIAHMMQISSRGNQFLQDNKIDNALFANEPEKCAAVVGLGLNLVYLLSALTWPYMPSTAESMAEQLNAPPARISDEWVMNILPGHNIGKAAYLFTRIDESKEAEWKAQYGGGSGVSPKS